MARGVRFTKPERALIRKLIGGTQAHHVGSLTQQKVAQEVLRKLDEAEQPKERGGAECSLTLTAAIDAFRIALAKRLVMPPNPPPSWYAIQQKKLNNLGLTRESAFEVAKKASEQWNGPVKVESLINQAAALLADTSDFSTPAQSMAPNLVDGTGDLDEL